jgi:sugar (pentulose or hexulose) kinase
MQERQFSVGIDVGTSGVRVIVADTSGTVCAEAARPLTGVRQAERHEQEPEQWWTALCDAAREAAAQFKAARGARELRGMAVTSTSGTLVVTDRDGRPLRPAIMYDDGRSGAEAETLNATSTDKDTRWNASHSLAKLAWVRSSEPGIWERVRYALHPADWIAGRLVGEYGFSDYSNTLKLGYDFEAGDWHPAVAAAGLRGEYLPKVLAPGTQVGVLSAAAAAATGLPAGLPVLAGVTDGIASLIASGAHAAGDANTTLGSTLVWKALSPAKPRSAHGIYSHRHPGGLWAPGAASNTGPGAIRARDSRLGPEERDRMAADRLPTDLLCYVLPSQGERFPFANRSAATFFEREPADTAESHAAQLQAIAFAERWGYELMAQCGVAAGGSVFSAGTAARSPVLSQLRANVLNRAIVRCCNPSAGFGAAILSAGAASFGGDLFAAIRAMAKPAEAYAPAEGIRGRFDDLYARFREACGRRGYDS